MEELGGTENTISTVSISNLPSGIYILNGITEDDTIVHSVKFVKSE